MAAVHRAELALGRLVAGDAAQAVARIESALAGGSAVDRGCPNDWTLSSLADAAAIAGDFDAAREAAAIAEAGFRQVIEEDIEAARAEPPVAGAIVQDTATRTSTTSRRSQSSGISRLASTRSQPRWPHGSATLAAVPER